MATLSLTKGISLRLVLRLDAVASGAIGVAFLALTSVLTDLLGIPATVLLSTGGFLTVYAAWLLFIAARPEVSRGAVGAAIAINLLWVADSAVYVAAGWAPFTTLGVAFTVFQAVAVLGFAGLQYAGLKQK